MKKFIFIPAVIILAFNCSAQSNYQPDKRILATADGYKITVEEFKSRFDLSSHPGTDKPLDTALVKKDYLYTLIAEKLLARKAESLKLGAAEDVSGQLKYIEKLYVRDALYKKEISDKIKITPADISKAEKHSSEILFVKFLRSADIIHIGTLYSQLKKGAKLDSLLAGRPEAADQKSLLKVTFGSLGGFVEDSLYKLKPGQFTAPLMMENQWYIFKLYKIAREPFSDSPTNLIKIRSILEKTQADNLEKVFLKSIRRRYNIKIDGHLFTELTEASKKYFKGKASGIKEGNKPGFIYLTADDINGIENLLRHASLNSKFIKFKVRPETLKRFLEQLKYEEIKIDFRSLGAIRYIFNEIIKNYVQNELLTREGYKLGLEKSSRVKKDMSAWKSYYLSQKLEREIYDSIFVSDKEAREFFEKHRKFFYKPDVPADSSFAENKNEIISKIKNIVLENKLNDYTAGLALKYGVKINENIFHSIKVRITRGATVKMIGFGGKILAFPNTPVFAGWYRVYLNKKSR